MKKQLLSILLLSLFCTPSVYSQSTITVRESPSVNLRKFVPAGSYSGITHLAGSNYAVVSDSEIRDGFFKFKIVLDEESGAIKTVENSGFYSSDTSNRDAECVAYNPVRKTIYVGGEKNNSIVEYDLNGRSTGSRSGNLFPGSRSNQGMESLCYDTKNNLLWSINESTLLGDNSGNYTTATNGVANMVRLTAFDTNFNKVREYAYLVDTPDNLKKANTYANGVSDICILDDGKILVLEREAYIPSTRFGAWVNCKIYMVSPQTSKTINIGEPLTSDSPFMFKSLLWSSKTHMSFRGLNWANYEGMCLGPKLKDGSQTILLISDSQNRHKGVLQDWMKVLVMK